MASNIQPVSRVITCVGVVQVRDDQPVIIVNFTHLSSGEVCIDEDGEVSQVATEMTHSLHCACLKVDP